MYLSYLVMNYHERLFINCSFSGVQIVHSYHDLKQKRKRKFRCTPSRFNVVVGLMVSMKAKISRQLSTNNHRMTSSFLCVEMCQIKTKTYAGCAMHVAAVFFQQSAAIWWT